MRRPALVWGSILGALSVFDLWCARNATQGDSLSECARLVYRTHTRAGRVALGASWAILTAWLLPHLWNPAGPDRADSRSGPPAAA